MVSIPLWILFLVVGPNEVILCFCFKDAQLPQIGSHGNEVKEVSDDCFLLPSLTRNPYESCKLAQRHGFYNEY